MFSLVLRSGGHPSPVALVALGAQFALALALAACTGDTRPLDPAPAIELPPEGCGDGVVSADEACEDGQLGDHTCASFGFPGGALTCARSCRGFVVAGCTGLPTWADGAPDPCAACGPSELCVDDVCVPACRSAELSEGTYTADVRVVEVSGRLLLGGAPLEGASEHGAGLLVLRNLATEHETVVPVLGPGLARYAAALYPGRYRVEHTGGDGAQVPRQARVVLESLEVDAPRTLDLDLPAPVRLEVALTIAGARREKPLYVAFVETSAPKVELTGGYEPGVNLEAGRTDGASALVYPGRYDLRVHSGNLYLPVVAPVDLVIRRDLEVTRDTQVTDDLPRRYVLVAPTLGGGPIPAGHELIVRARREGLPPELALPLGPLLAGASTAVLPDGRWIFELELTTREVWGTLVRRAVRTVEVTGDARVTMDVDAATTDVFGTIQRATSTRDTKLRLTERGGRASAEVDVSGFAQAALALRLPRGTYDLAIDPPHPLGAGLEVLAPAELAVGDEPVSVAVTHLPPPLVWVHGRVMVNGVAPSSTALVPPSYAQLLFVCKEGCTGDALEYLDDERGTRYDVSLALGTYEVWIAGAASRPLPDERPITSAYDLPRRAYLADPHFVVRGPTERDFDVVVHALEVEVESNAGPLPEVDAPGFATPARERASLRFEPAPTAHPEHLEVVSGAELPPVPDRGPARWATAVFPGRYRVSLVHAGPIEMSDEVRAPYFAVDRETRRVIDLELHTVTGALTFAGGAWPSATGAILHVGFWGDGSWTEVPVDARGRFTALVPRGFDDVVFYSEGEAPPFVEGSQRLAGTCGVER